MMSIYPIKIIVRSIQVNTKDLATSIVFLQIIYVFWISCHQETRHYHPNDWLGCAFTFSTKMSSSTLASLPKAQESIFSFKPYLQKCSLNCQSLEPSLFSQVIRYSFLCWFGRDWQVLIIQLWDMFLVNYAFHKLSLKAFKIRIIAISY